MTVLYPFPNWIKFLKTLLFRYILIDLGERKNSWHSWICPRLCKGPLVTAKLSFLVEFYWHPKHQTKLQSDTYNSWQKGNFVVTLTEKVSPLHKINMIVWKFSKTIGWQCNMKQMMMASFWHPAPPLTQQGQCQAWDKYISKFKQMHFKMRNKI